MTPFNTQTLRGAQVIGSDGSKLGKVQEIYADNRTNQLDWAEIKTGLFGNHVSLVPLSRAEQTDEGLRVPFDKETVKGAAHHEPGRALGADEEARLFSYYGIPYGGDTVTAQPGQTPRGRHAATDGRSGRAADGATTRSEEEMVVGTSPDERGEVRLRKYVETEISKREHEVIRHEE